jgi:hypothetical protein
LFNIFKVRTNVACHTPCAPQALDELTYVYDWRYQNTAVPSEQRELQTNRLYHVWDAVNSANYSDDIDDQGAYGTAAGQLDTSTLQTFQATANYAYDELGNLSCGSSKPDLNFGCVWIKG